MVKLSLYPTRASAFCCAVYFVQGILGLARLAVTYFYKDELQLDPVRTSPQVDEQSMGRLSE